MERSGNGDSEPHHCDHLLNGDHIVTREQIIEHMCMTYRHDYGLVVSELDKIEMPLSCGMTETERNSLRRTMAQIFDNDIAPNMVFKTDLP
jgi:hypothetical protein